MALVIGAGAAAAQVAHGPAVENGEDNEDQFKEADGGVVITENSARGESQSHGVAEQNASIVSEFIRVLKLQIDEKILLGIGVDHAFTRGLSGGRLCCLHVLP